MRTFEERKAEILRRSEKKVRERRIARRRLAAILVPFGVLVAVWGVTALPAMMPAGADIGNQEMFDGATEDVIGSGNGSVNAVVAVRITSSAESATHPREITDADRVTALHCAVLDLYNEPQAGTSGGENKGEAGKPQALPPVYTIRFLSADGSYSEYRLYENELYAVSGGVRFALTDTQVRELKELMDLTE